MGSIMNRSIEYIVTYRVVRVTKVTGSSSGDSNF
jgi:hypothetical protein